MRRRIAALAGVALFFSAADGAPMHARRASHVAAETEMMHELKATKDTVHWGYFSKEVAPSLTISNGDTVKVEMVSVSSPACHWCDALPSCAQPTASMSDAHSELTDTGTLQHHAGDNPDLMITNDTALEGIFKWGPTGPGTTHEVSFP